MSCNARIIAQFEMGLWASPSTEDFVEMHVDVNGESVFGSPFSIPVGAKWRPHEEVSDPLECVIHNFLRQYCTDPLAGIR